MAVDVLNFGTFTSIGTTALEAQTTSFRPDDEEWNVCEQVVLPLTYCHHDSLGGHLGTKKILEQINCHFYWPSIRKDVQRFFVRHACQVVGKPGGAPTVAPLQLLPVEQEPFSQFMIDCVGPLPKSKRGNEYLLAILDVATRYPEATPLRRRENDSRSSC